MKNNIIKINKNEIIPIEYKNQRVVTLKMIDQLHERPEGTAGRNFRQHKEKFIKNIHYFLISADKLPSNEIQRTIKKGGNKKNVYLFTEKGYLKLVKSFQDNLSWEIQDKLIDSYFIMKKLFTELDMQRAMLKARTFDVNESIKESGANEKMHGHAYSNYADLLNRIVLGMSAKQYKEKYNLSKSTEIREHLTKTNPEMLKKYDIGLKVEASLISANMEYQEIKEIIEKIYHNDKKKLEKVG